MRTTFKLMTKSLAGVWLGIWTISGIAMGTGGILILAMQCYGWLYLDFWFPLTPARILQGMEVAIPSISWPALQRVIDCLLRLPLSAVFVWCGFNIAAMAWIARKNLERRLLVPQLILVTTHDRFRNHGVETLQVRPD
jgi:hypothetical protein